jgi:clan AA aspartic protease
VEVWIDTGFTGDLVLPRAWIERLALNASGTVTAVLADGAEVAMRTYTCFVHWYGRRERLEIVESDGAYPLLGVGLLFERDLRINYHDGTVSLE